MFKLCWYLYLFPCQIGNQISITKYLYKTVDTKCDSKNKGENCFASKKT